MLAGFVKNLHNNNIGDNNEKSFLQKVREFFVKRSSYSFFIFSDHSRYLVSQFIIRWVLQLRCTIFIFQHQTILQGSNIQRLVWLYYFNLHSCQLHHLGCGETHHPTLVRVGKVFLDRYWQEACQVQGEKHPACVQHPVQLRVHRGDGHEGRGQWVHPGQE